MEYLKIAIVLISSGLFYLGGNGFLFCRRFILPVLLTLSCLLYSHWDWYSLTMLSCIGIFCLGYGVKSPLRHCFGNGWGRGVWGTLAGLCLGLGLCLTGHVYWFFFVPYLFLSFTLENALKDLPTWIGDPIIGAGFASIVLITHP